VYVSHRDNYCLLLTDPDITLAVTHSSYRHTVGVYVMRCSDPSECW